MFFFCEAHPQRGGAPNVTPPVRLCAWADPWDSDCRLKVPKDDAVPGSRGWIGADGEVDAYCQFWGRPPSCDLEECLAGCSDGGMHALGGFCLFT